MSGRSSSQKDWCCHAICFFVGLNRLWQSTYEKTTDLSRIPFAIHITPFLGTTDAHCVFWLRLPHRWWLLKRNSASSIRKLWGLIHQSCHYSSSFYFSRDLEICRVQATEVEVREARWGKWMRRERKGRWCFWRRDVLQLVEVTFLSPLESLLLFSVRGLKIWKASSFFAVSITQSTEKFFSFLWNALGESANFLPW